MSVLVWLSGLLKELGVGHKEPTMLCCDSKAKIQIAANSISHERTKYIEIDCHFMRENLQSGLI